MVAGLAGGLPSLPHSEVLMGAWLAGLPQSTGRTICGRPICTAAELDLN